MAIHINKSGTPGFSSDTHFSITLISRWMLMILVLSGCKKSVLVAPPATQLVSTSVFVNNITAAAAVTSIYDNMIKTDGLSSGIYSLSLLNGLAADELKNYTPSNTSNQQFYINALNSQSPYFWIEIYQEIYVANSVIEGLQTSTGVTPNIKNQLLGEAKFMRAFLHFYAVNLYGDVPLVITTDYHINNVIKRTPENDVYNQIKTDLKDAQNLLSDKFLTPGGSTTTERVRPNKAAATALLARVYLYLGDWANAELQANAIINNTANYSLVTNLNQVFLENSSEAIWQLQSIRPGYNTFDGKMFILTSPPGSGSFSVALSSSLVNAFEAGDNRFNNWIGQYTSGAQTYFYPFKYKIGTVNVSNPVTEYTMVLRLAEQYLIRAEARARQDNILGATGALMDLNMIRQRAGLANYPGATDKISVLAAILHERQVELFTEWGHRWFDLKRTGNLNSVMGSPGNICQGKGGTWRPNSALLPIPQSDILINPNLTQNPGYN